MTRIGKSGTLLTWPMRVLSVICVFAFVFFFAACEHLEKPAPSPYFADPVPPAKQELHWSNGKLPKSFDPALAESPPETDIVRSIYRGVATLDPKTLTAVPAVAEKWSTSDDRIWMFQIRKDAKWTNGKNVTAADFVRSWNRLVSLGEKASHPELLKNFARVKATVEGPAKLEPSPLPRPEKTADGQATNSEPSARAESSPSPTATPIIGNENKEKITGELAVKAEGDLTLQVTLETPDPDLPRILASPIFSPIYGDGSEFTSASPDTIVTDGPFRLASMGKDGLTLVKSETFFDRDSVKLDTVKIVPTESAEEALEAYRSGAIDVVTNTEFEPAALKLLAPFDDFRKATHGAVNLYEFNRSRPVFNDARVRQALAMAIERERLTEGELEGSTRPAFRFLPFGGKTVTPIVQDVDQAQELLDTAGYPDGKDFPTIRLVVNRNDTQLRIARAVARMWKQNLDVNTEIIVKEQSEIAGIRVSGDYDLIRRGVVFPTSDPQSNLEFLLSAEPTPHETESVKYNLHEPPASQQQSNSSLTTTDARTAHGETLETQRPTNASVTTEAEALVDLPAIPLYFPTSYSLVKPYVHGFDPNGLDLLLLDEISIDNNWQPTKPVGQS